MYHRFLFRSHQFRNASEPVHVCFVSPKCRTCVSNSVAIAGAGGSGHPVEEVVSGHVRDAYYVAASERCREPSTSEATTRPFAAGHHDRKSTRGFQWGG